MPTDAPAPSAMLVWTGGERSLIAGLPFGAFYHVQLGPNGMWYASLISANMTTRLPNSPSPTPEAARAACEADCRERVETLAAAILTDPVAVHRNMLAGRIATPTVAQFVHVVGDARMRAAGWVPAGDEAASEDRCKAMAREFLGLYGTKEAVEKFCAKHIPAPPVATVSADAIRAEALEEAAKLAYGFGDQYGIATKKRDGTEKLRFTKHEVDRTIRDVGRMIAEDIRALATPPAQNGEG